MKILRLISCAVLALVLSVANCQAWSSAGHEVIAAIAYRQLPPEIKVKVDGILQAHPEYQKWAAAGATNSTGVDLGAYVFMRASTWPDEIRRRNNPYDHPQWHYIDYPLKPPDFPMEPAPSPNEDILFGIQISEKTLSQESAAPVDQAASLSWLIHLLGDIHQPLHCASLFNATFPAGDRGGNSAFVKPDRAGIPLHSFWDQLLGSSDKTGDHWNYAIQIAAEYPETASHELCQAGTPKEWSLESRQIAAEKAYLKGTLAVGTSKASAPPLPAGYAGEAKTIAERQAALAGYRLASGIRRLIQ